MTTQNSRAAYFTENAMAVVLGLTLRTLGKWRASNTNEVHRLIGPPYETLDDGAVVYPQGAFAAWCARVPFVDGVPRMGMACQPQTTHTATGAIH